MDLKMKSLQRVSVQAAFLLLAACGSSPQKDTVVEDTANQPARYFVGKKPVYATLISGSGGNWIFDEITESNLPPKKGYLIRLNDLAPAFDTRVAECTPQAYPSSHKCNPTHPFRNKDVGVISKIISGGIAAGTAGKVTDVSRTYETAFDEPAFNQAIDEALVNSNLDRERHDLIEALETYTALIQSSQKTLREIENSSNAEYRNTNAVQLDIRPQISGLTEYFTNDLNYRDLIKLVPKRTKNSADSGPKAKNLLPCEARLCVQKARVEIANVRADVEKAKMRLLSDDTRIYGVRCDKNQHAGYLLKIDCPEEVVRAPDGPAQFPLSLNILARDFGDLYPSVNLGDENLVIDIDAGLVTFFNKTSGYLSINAQTVYYNAEMSTSSTEINLAPGARAMRSLDDFVSPAISIESNYMQMTPGKADSATFEFGFAVKYSAANRGTENTLFENRHFNVGCVIDNRLNPGSCKQPGVEKMQAHQRAPVPYRQATVGI